MKVPLFSSFIFYILDICKCSFAGWQLCGLQAVGLECVVFVKPSNFRLAIFGVRWIISLLIRKAVFTPSPPRRAPLPPAFLHSECRSCFAPSEVASLQSSCQNSFLWLFFLSLFPFMVVANSSPLPNIDHTMCLMGGEGGFYNGGGGSCTSKRASECFHACFLRFSFFLYLKKSVLGVCPAVTKIDQRRKYVGVSVFECLMFLRQAAGSTPMAQDCCASLPADKKFVIYFLSRGLPDRIEIIYLASLYSVFSMFRVLKALKQAKKKAKLFRRFQFHLQY